MWPLSPAALSIFIAAHHTAHESQRAMVVKSLLDRSSYSDIGEHDISFVYAKLRTYRPDVLGPPATLLSRAIEAAAIRLELGSNSCPQCGAAWSVRDSAVQSILFI